MKTALFLSLTAGACFIMALRALRTNRPASTAFGLSGLVLQCGALYVAYF